MNSLQGKVVLITGATSGVGRALALACAGEGANLILCGRDFERLLSVMDEAKRCGAGELYGEAFSVREAEAIRDFVQTAESALGPVDILVNNAGLNSGRGVTEEIDMESWCEMMEVNALAPILFAAQVLPAMKERGAGRIVNILSSVCLYASAGLGAYTASKSACKGWTDVLRRECQPFGIQVTGVFIGGVNTAFRPQPRPEYMSAQSVAGAILCLLKTPDDACAHELVMRPGCETNFA